MSGHGHVTPNADGSKARCGGPMLCSTCNRESGVVAERHRNAVDGRFETAADAAAHPATSVTESLKGADLARAARDLLEVLESSGDIALLSGASVRALVTVTEILGD